MTTSLDKRISIKCIVLGCVSAGKSTLINSMLISQLSNTKKRRTTMVPQVYLETDTNDTNDINQILEDNNKSNKDILDGIVTLTNENCNEVYHKINKLYNVFTLPSGIYLDIYDMPGLNDSTTEDIYYNYIKNHFEIFDIFLIVVSIEESFNTSGSIKILDTISKYSKEYPDKRVNICIVANKCDELIIKKDTNELDFMDEEYVEMFEQIKREVNKRFKPIENITYDILKLSAEDSYIYRMYKNDPKVVLEQTLMNKFGLNEYGKRVWNKLNDDQKKNQIRKFLNEGNINECLKLTGFPKFRNYLQNTINYTRQFEIITTNIQRNINNIPDYTDQYETNITDLYDEYINLSEKMYNIYRTKCKLSDTNPLLELVNNHLHKNFEKRMTSYTYVISTPVLFTYYNDIKIKIKNTCNTLLSLIKPVNIYYSKINEQQNNWILQQLKLQSSYGSLNTIIGYLKQLVQNDYDNITDLIHEEVNQLIISNMYVLTTTSDDIITYIVYIKSLDYDSDLCFKFVQDFYKSYIKSIKQDYLLQVECCILEKNLNHLDFTEYNEEFQTYLYKLKLTNDIRYSLLLRNNIVADDTITPDIIKNSESVFMFIIEMYCELDE